MDLRRGDMRRSSSSTRASTCSISFSFLTLACEDLPPGGGLRLGASLPCCCDASCCDKSKSTPNETNDEAQKQIIIIIK